MGEPTPHHGRIFVPCECSQCAPFNEPDVVSFEWRDGWCQTITDCPTDCPSCPDNVLSEFTPEERHEFHLLLNQTAYCICGWTVSRPSPIGHLTKEEAAERSSDMAWFGEQYREHLG